MPRSCASHSNWRRSPILSKPCWASTAEIRDPVETASFRSPYGPHRPYLRRHAEYFRRGDTVAYALDGAGPSGRDSHCRASPVAHDLHPLHPAIPARPDARRVAALLRALERADVGADRPVADRFGPAVGDARASRRGDRQESVFAVFRAETERSTTPP